MGDFNDNSHTRTQSFQIFLSKLLLVDKMDTCNDFTQEPATYARGPNLVDSMLVSEDHPEESLPLNLPVFDNIWTLCMNTISYVI